MHTTLMNMCMVYDAARRRAVVIDRARSWRGIAFPGGHVEPGESLMAAVEREVWEETGLRVRDVRYVGLVHWYNMENDEREIVFLYRSDRFEGELSPGTEEGRVFWADVDELPHMKLAPGMGDHLKQYEDDGIREAYYRPEDGTLVML